MVFSPQTKYVMAAWFAKSAPMLGLAAENGFFYRWPIGRKDADEKW